MLKIVQVNICGLSQRSVMCLDKYINEQNADIVCLSEIKTHKQNDFTNYTSVYASNNNKPVRKGGVAILCLNKHTIEHQPQLENARTDAIFTIVTIKNIRILVCSVYIPPNATNELKLFLDQLQAVTGQLSHLKCSSLAVFGDFNARHSDWADKTNNKAGQMLSNYVNQSSLTILDRYTGDSFLCDTGGSRIDLAVVSNNLLQLVNDQFSDSDIELFTGAPNRGHLPIWSTFDISPISKSPRKIPNWVSTDWEYFANTLDELSLKIMPTLANVTDPHELWNLAKGLLHEAKAYCISYKTVTEHSKPYWNNELSNLSKDLRTAKRSFKARSNFINGSKLQLAKDKFSQALTEAKNTYLASISATLSVAEGPAFWKSFNRTFYPKSSNSRQIGSISDNHGNQILDDRCKAQLLFKDIFQGKHLDHCSFNDQWKDFIDASVRSPSFYEGQNSLNDPITCEEILQSIRRLSTSAKSIDNDGIHPLMLKHCGNQFPIILFKLFNAVITSTIWPWSDGEVIFLRKPGKTDYTLTSSYRPITITSYMGKLLERILVVRLTQYMDSHVPLSKSQHGFRKGYSTSTYMYNLISSIQHSTKSKQKVAGIFVDLQKAFDSVWHNGLLYKLHKLGIRGNFLKVLCNFLTGRHISLKVNNYTLSSNICTIGVPQGSVLSPLLFNIYINDMLENIEGTALQYADDMSIIVTAKDNAHLLQSCQSNCDKLSTWLKCWRLKANCSKTDFLLFQGECDTPTLSGDKINSATNTKVLGITIDSKLAFKLQLATATQTLKSKWSLLKPFIFTNLSVTATRKILSSVILPKTCYLAHLWDTQIKFSIYSALKDMLRVPFFPPGEHLHVFSRIFPLPILYTYQRLNLAKQLLLHNDLNILEKYHKSPIAQSVKSDFLKYTGTRRLDDDQAIISFKKSQINKHIYKRWQMRWQTCCLQFNSSQGLLGLLADKSSLIYYNKIPLHLNPRIIGSLCALITGHTRLQLHTYKLKLTYSPTCVCLEEDESPHHYLFNCKLYNHARICSMPILPNWESIIEFIKLTNRFP